MARRSPTGSQRAFSAVALVAVVAAVSGEAASGQSTPGSFGVSPAIRDLVARAPRFVGTSTVTNTTRSPLTVTVSPTLLAQAIDGGVVARERRPELDAAARLLRVTPERFELPPNSTRTIRMTWLGTLPGKRAAYLGALISGLPPGASPAGVKVRPRLLQVLRLRLPGSYRSRGRFFSLRGIQAAPRKLRFFAGVQNLGEAAGKPRQTRFTVRDAAGTVVLRNRWPADVLVLPGAKVEFPINPRKVLPAGRYTGTAEMRFDRDPALRRIRMAFTLTGPNELPTTDFSLDGLEARGEVGGPAHVTARVKATGTAPGAVIVKVKLFAGSATRPTAVAAPRTGLIGRGSTVSQEVVLGRLAEGNYRAKVVIGDGRRAFASNEIAFRASAPRSLFDRFKGVLVGLAALLVVAALVLLAARNRRERRRLEAELARARGGLAETADDERSG